MATVELHVNATYYTQHPKLKLVYGKKTQSVIHGKLFSSYRTVFELAQGLWDSKTSDLNCSYDALVQMEGYPYMGGWGGVGNTLLFSNIRNIFAGNTLSKTGEIPILSNL